MFSSLAKVRWKARLSADPRGRRAWLAWSTAWERWWPRDTAAGGEALVQRAEHLAAAGFAYPKTRRPTGLFDFDLPAYLLRFPHESYHRTLADPVTRQPHHLSPHAWQRLLLALVKAQIHRARPGWIWKLALAGRHRTVVRALIAAGFRPPLDDGAVTLICEGGGGHPPPQTRAAIRRTRVWVTWLLRQGLPVPAEAQWPFRWPTLWEHAQTQGWAIEPLAHATAELHRRIQNLATGSRYGHTPARLLPGGLPGGLTGLLDWFDHVHTQRGEVWADQSPALPLLSLIADSIEVSTCDRDLPMDFWISLWAVWVKLGAPVDETALAQTLRTQATTGHRADRFRNLPVWDHERWRPLAQALWARGYPTRAHLDGEAARYAPLPALHCERLAQLRQQALARSPIADPGRSRHRA